MPLKSDHSQYAKGETPRVGAATVRSSSTNPTAFYTRFDPVLNLLAVLLGVTSPLFFSLATAGWWLAGVILVFAGIKALVGNLQFPVPLIGLIIGLCASGIAGTRWQYGQLPKECERQRATVSGVIVDFPKIELLQGDTRQRFKLEVDAIAPAACRSPEVLQVSYWKQQPELALGQRLTAEVTLLPPRSQWNPGLLPDQLSTLTSGVDARANAINISVISDDAQWPHSIRRRLSTRIDGQKATSRARALLAALVVGQGSVIGKNDWARFQRLGLSHVLVISGLHIGLVFGLVWVFVGRVVALIEVLRGRFCTGAPSVRGHKVNPLKVLPVVMALSTAASYALMAGFAVPTQRALIMLSCFSLTRLLGWRTVPWRILLLAVVVVLLLDPFAFLGRSLWMSAGATAVLIGLAGRFTAFPGRTFHRQLAGAIALQTALVLVMAPITLFWFGKLSVAAVVCNLLFVTPLALLVVPLALLGAVGHFITAELGDSLWWLALRMLELIIPVIDSLDQTLGDLSVLELPISPDVPALNPFELQQMPWLAVGAMLIASLFPYLASLVMQQLRAAAVAASLTVLDVGQGLAVLWQEGTNTMLYDTGAGVPDGFSQAQKVIVPLLKKRGISRLQTVVISHSDTDHSGGLNVIKQASPIAAHWGFGGTPCRAGKRLQWRGEASLWLLNGETRVGPSASDNANSCVLMIEFRGRRLLIAGDIPVKRERELVRYWREALAADVLIVGHHGSHTSTAGSFLKWVRPRWAVISAGRANRFGHPAIKVTDRLNSLGIPVLNTADVGAVTFDLDFDGQIHLRKQRSGTFPYWLQLP